MAADSDEKFAVWRSPRQREAHEWLDGEMANLRVAFRWAMAHADVDVAARIASKKRKGHERVDHYTSETIRIRADRPQEVQVDGDTLGKARAINAEIVPGALVVRVGSPD